jgi:hypothetical protein
MEFAILFIFSIVLIFYFNVLRRESDDTTEVIPKVLNQPKPVKKNEKIIHEKKEEKKKEIPVIPQEIKEVKIKRRLIKEEIPTVKNAKDALINTFRDGKDLTNVHVYNEGKIILASDVLLILLSRKKKFSFLF